MGQSVPVFEFKPHETVNAVISNGASKAWGMWQVDGGWWVCGECMLQ